MNLNHNNIIEALWEWQIVISQATRIDREDDGRGALVGDWKNAYERWPRIMRQLEKRYNILWEDEYYTADNGVAYRVVPNSWDWEPRLLIAENGEIYTPEDGVQEWIDNLPRYGVLPSWWTTGDLEEAGYVCVGVTLTQAPSPFVNQWVPSGYAAWLKIDL